MQPLMQPKVYPPELRHELMKSGRIMRAIANRWILGWPGRVKKLIELNEYLPALKEQTELELDAIAENADSWLTETEKVQLAGLSLECPIPRT